MAPSESNETMITADTTQRNLEVVQWLLDTRNLWPEASETRHLESVASRALSLLPPAERASVLRFHFARDAKMSLASHLLKHYLVARYCRVPWRRSTITRDARSKPVFVAPEGGSGLASFNVSHQAGVVVLAAVVGYGGPGPVDVGVDVVCTSERRGRDRNAIARDGWAAFVDVHADVFGPGETSWLKHHVPGPDEAGGESGGSDSEWTVADETDTRLRYFYALWCLREAYVKMTGEALLAEWLRELEFRDFRPPDPVQSFKSTPDDGRWAVRDHDIMFRGGRVEDANVCLAALGPDYMICTAVRTPDRKGDGLNMRLGAFESLSVEEILDFAESHL